MIDAFFRDSVEEGSKLGRSSKVIDMMQYCMIALSVSRFPYEKSRFLSEEESEIIEIEQN